MTRFLRSSAAAALGTVLITTVLSVSATGSAPADPAQTLVVDFSTDTGAFRGGATGTLYGLGDTGAPTRALVNGARITNTSQKAPGGT